MVTGAPADRRTVGDLVQEPVSRNKGWKAPWMDASLAFARFSLSLTLRPGLSPCLYTPCQDLINSSSALREERRSKSDRRDGGRVEKEETGGKRKGRRNGGGWEGDEAESVSCETVMDNRMKSGCLWTAKQKWSPPPSHGESLIALSLSFVLLFTCQIFCECSSERFSNLKDSPPASWYCPLKSWPVFLYLSEDSQTVGVNLIISLNNWEWFFFLSLFCEILSLCQWKPNLEFTSDSSSGVLKYFKYSCRKKNWRVQIDFLPT